MATCFLIVMNNVAFAFWVMNISGSVCRWWWMSLFLQFDYGKYLCFCYLIDWLMWTSLFFTGHCFPVSRRRRGLPITASGNQSSSSSSESSEYQNHPLDPHYYHHHQINFFLLITTTIGIASAISVSCCLLGPNWSDQYQHSLTVFVSVILLWTLR